MSEEFAPVRVEGPSPSEIHVIDTVADALGFLYSLWPGETPKRALAEQACVEALAGRITPATARQIFYDAAEDAGILAEN